MFFFKKCNNATLDLTADLFDSQGELDWNPKSQDSFSTYFLQESFNFCVYQLIKNRFKTVEFSGMF